MSVWFMFELVFVIVVILLVKFFMLLVFCLV